MKKTLCDKAKTHFPDGRAQNACDVALALLKKPEPQV
jgi:hypothetical protein